MFNEVMDKGHSLRYVLPRAVAQGTHRSDGITGRLETEPDHTT